MLARFTRKLTFTCDWPHLDHPDSHFCTPSPPHQAPSTRSPGISAPPPTTLDAVDQVALHNGSSLSVSGALRRRPALPNRCAVSCHELSSTSQRYESHGTMRSRSKRTIQDARTLILLSQEQFSQASQNGYQFGAHKHIDSQRGVKRYEPKTLNDQDTALEVYKR